MRWVIGIDEVGRGALAGPVTVAAVVAPEDWELEGLTDSKKLTERKRALLFPDILAQVTYWCIAQSSSEQVDAFGVGSCLQELFYTAVTRCLSRYSGKVIIDGDKPIRGIDRSAQLVIKKADQIFQTVSAASVIAKVFRDVQMITLHDDHPIYGFDRNKGYGTQGHIRMVREHGICPQHRRSFRPISTMLQEGVINVKDGV